MQSIYNTYHYIKWAAVAQEEEQSPANKKVVQLLASPDNMSKHPWNPMLPTLCMNVQKKALCSLYNYTD